MKLEILKIHEKGKQNSEYVELRAKEACNLTDYLLSDTTYTSETTISNKLRHVHWFSPQNLEKGDYVFLRTGKGINTSHKNKAGTTTYVIHWGLGTPVWNNTGDAGMLIEISGRQTMKA